MIRHLKDRPSVLNFKVLEVHRHARHLFGLNRFGNLLFDWAHYILLPLQFGIYPISVVMLVYMFAMELIVFEFLNL